MIELCVYFYCKASDESKPPGLDTGITDGAVGGVVGGALIVIIVVVCVIVVCIRWSYKKRTIVTRK